MLLVHTRAPATTRPFLRTNRKSSGCKPSGPCADHSSSDQRGANWWCRLPVVETGDQFACRLEQEPIALRNQAGATTRIGALLAKASYKFTNKFVSAAFQQAALQEFSGAFVVGNNAREVKNRRVESTGVRKEFVTAPLKLSNRPACRASRRQSSEIATRRGVH